MDVPAVRGRLGAAAGGRGQGDRRPGREDPPRAGADRGLTGAELGAGRMIRAAWADLPRVCSGWTIPRTQTVSEWAASNRVLNERESAEPGPWNNERAPYLREIMDACGDPDVGE